MKKIFYFFSTYISKYRCNRGVTAAFELFALKSNYNQVLINEAQYQLMRECPNRFRII